MEAFLRAFDRNLAQRRLRWLLVEIAGTGGEAARVPRSFDGPRLLSQAEEILGSRGIRRSARYLSLLARAGVLYALSDRPDRARELFELGAKESKRARDEARFLHLIANQIHFRTGNAHEARLAFEEVIERRRIGRNLADEAYLGLARTAKQQQDLATAERVYSRLRVSGVLKYRPLAELYLGVLRKDQQRYDEAVALNRSAYAAFKAAGEELGMRLADGDLAVIEMKRGDYGKARGILEGLVDEHMKILDTNAAGLAYNNLAAACAELPDLPAARDAYLRGLSCHAAAGRKRLMAGTYSNLGTTLSKLGEIETAFAAFDRAVELAERVGSADLGLRVRRAELEAILRHRTRLARVPTLAARCDEIIKKWGHEISNEAFREYTTTLFQVLGAGMGTGSGERAAGETPAPLGREAGSRLDELTGETTDSHYRELLTERLGDGMHRRSAPPVSDLRDFLLLFMGDYLRFHDYVGEFFISPSRGKLQLRELCQRRILAVTGTRRAGKYSLAFHRT